MVLTREIADWLADLRLDDIPALAVERATASILDMLGVTLAGLSEPPVRIAARLAAADGAAPVASQIGTGLRTSMEWAAFVNGIAAHALDYDDVSYAVIGHPTVVVLPAVLAVAEATGASGASVLTAYIGGVEVMAKLARVLGNEHYLTGWHMTATAGCFASAAAAAKLLGLDASGIQMALGIAASSAAGLQANFGTMTKPHHAGHAGRSGVSAARLAGAGFTASPDVFEGRRGFLAAHGADPAGAEADLALGAPFELESPGLGIKRYPCCYGTHRALDGLFSLIEQHGLSGSDLAHAEVSAPPAEVQPLIYPRPHSGLEGKFSMQYALAAALVDGAVGLSSFEDQMVERPEVQALIPRIEVRPFEPGSPEAAGGLAGGDGVVRVTVQTHTGRRLQEQIRYARGAPENPVGMAEVITKFRDCAAGRLTEEQVSRAVEQVVGLRDADDLTALRDALVVSPVGAGAR
ncbi:MAG: MmgE/PrpD family protein [Chloroflexi bacterium]|nr:MmgE/PrpD family protein [Chloroflexota bacterium]